MDVRQPCHFCPVPPRPSRGQHADTSATRVTGTPKRQVDDHVADDHEGTALPRRQNPGTPASSFPTFIPDGARTSSSRSQTKACARCSYWTAGLRTPNTYGNAASPNSSGRADRSTTGARVTVQSRTVSSRCWGPPRSAAGAAPRSAALRPTRAAPRRSGRAALRRPSRRTAWVRRCRSPGPPRP